MNIIGNKIKQKVITQISKEMNLFENIEFKNILEDLINVSTPKEANPTCMQMIKLDNKSLTGDSYKIGNILINWRKLAEKIPQILELIDPNLATIIATIVTAPGNVKDVIGIKITENEGCVIASLMECNGIGKYVEENIVKYKFDELAIKYNLCTDKENFENSCNKLIKYKCIDIQNGKLALIEEVKFTY